jgi:hypothetical protein
MVIDWDTDVSVEVCRRAEDLVWKLSRGLN